MAIDTTTPVSKILVNGEDVPMSNPELNEKVTELDSQVQDHETRIKTLEDGAGSGGGGLTAVTFDNMTDFFAYIFNNRDKIYYFKLKMSQSLAVNNTSYTYTINTENTVSVSTASGTRTMLTSGSDYIFTYKSYNGNYAYFETYDNMVLMTAGHYHALTSKREITAASETNITIFKNQYIELANYSDYFDFANSVIYVTE